MSSAFSRGLNRPSLHYSYFYRGTISTLRGVSLFACITYVTPSNLLRGALFICFFTANPCTRVADILQSIR